MQDQGGEKKMEERSELTVAIKKEGREENVM